MHAYTARSFVAGWNMCRKKTKRGDCDEASATGRSIDWWLARLPAPIWGAEACVVAGTDYLGVQVRLQAVDAGTLGGRMEQPARGLAVAKDEGASNIRFELAHA